MANTRWSFLEIAKRVCSKIGQPRPTALNAAEVANNEFYQDLVDVINMTVENLILRMWPEAVLKRDRIATIAPVSFIATINNAASALTADASTFRNLKFGEVWFNTHGVPYGITYTSVTEAVTDDPFQGTTLSGDTEDNAYYYLKAYALPTDFNRPVSPPHRFSTTLNMSLVSPEVFENKKYSLDVQSSENAWHTGAPQLCTIIYDSAGAKYLAIKPIPDGVYEIEINYYQTIDEFDPTSDTASSFYTLIPPENQAIIVPAVIRELFMYQLSDERFINADNQMREMLGLMSEGKDDSKGFFRITPTVVRSGRRLFSSGSVSRIRRLSAKYDMGDSFDWID